MLNLVSTLLAVGLTTTPAAYHHSAKPSVSRSVSRSHVVSQQGPHITARGAILMDARTGAIMYEKDAFRQLDPASVTKMMTAILVIEHGHLSKTVTISKNAAYTVGSALHIAPGQKYTVYDLLYGLLMRSGNDASVALAEADAGSVSKFVAQMNMKAQELGAFNTQFENPNGLTKPGHFSTAYDLALIARYAMTLPVFRKIVGTREGHIMELRHKTKRTLHNTNQLLYTFPDATGIKTGTTDAAGKCLVASATRNGQDLIAVVLHSQDRYADAKNLLVWGFEHWSTTEIMRPGEEVARIPVQKGQTPTVPVQVTKPLWLSLPNQETYEVYVRPILLRAPVKRHQPAGFVSVIATGQPAYVASLETMEADGVKTVHQSFWQWLRSRFSRGK
ncbi:D-alanyl-D-alanine carboxypeptidase family protein [Sulfobacillus thermosulfidooxidans]|uniref:D-alanyl-D-alanine carboxypeptidase family protein n=1 Tax=Sulfobacillus thermosulfidooxidans TaxID=28034 RepID=UPI0002F29580|nr:D-alanyl-D-alanine carboxypeptidase family protein [Sulfobacillus thermosulfidooxidans]